MKTLSVLIVLCLMILSSTVWAGMKLCGHCQGAGRGCGYCQGTGKIWVDSTGKRINPYDDNNFFSDVCGICKGTGKTPGGFPCDCGGSGRVWNKTFKSISKPPPSSLRPPVQVIGETKIKQAKPSKFWQDVYDGRK